MLNPSQAPFTLNRLFQLLKEAVKYFPKSGSIDLNTFLWVDVLSDLNPSNLGADVRLHGSDYFYSKRYDKKRTSTMEIAAPMLVVQELGGTYENIHKEANRPSQIAHRLRITVFDKYVNLKDQNATKDDRELPDVYKDCRTILRKVMKYLNNVKYCTITKLDASTESNYFNVDFLQYLVDESKITSFSSKENAVNAAFVSMIGQNTNSQYELLSPITGNNYIGVQIDYSIVETICESINFDFSQSGNDFIYGG